MKSSTMDKRSFKCIKTLDDYFVEGEYYTYVVEHIYNGFKFVRVFAVQFYVYGEVYQFNFYEFMDDHNVYDYFNLKQIERNQKINDIINE